MPALVAAYVVIDDGIQPGVTEPQVGGAQAIRDLLAGSARGIQEQQHHTTLRQVAGRQLAAVVGLRGQIIRQAAADGGTHTGRHGRRPAVLPTAVIARAARLQQRDDLAHHADDHDQREHL